MSKFTIKLPKHTTLVTLEECIMDQVDILVRDLNGRDYRIAAICDGKLHLFQINTAVAENIGLELDASRYPTITRV